MLPPYGHPGYRKFVISLHVYFNRSCKNQQVDVLCNIVSLCIVWESTAGLFGTVREEFLLFELLF
jgi:hypothetical protein